MNTVENHPRSATLIASSEVYDPDDVGGRSPILQAVVPNLSPSSSPEPMLPVSYTGPGKGPRKENRTSMGVAVLVHYMANGNHQDVSRQVASEPLASPEDGDQVDGTVGGTILRGKDREEVAERKGSTSEKEGSVGKENKVEDVKIAAHVEKDGEDLAVLAAKALKRSEQNPILKIGRINGSSAKPTTGEPMEDVNSTLPAIVLSNTPSRLIPDPLSIISEMQISSSAGALPPIQHLSSPALPDGTSSVTLPSIADQLGDYKNLPDTPREQNFPQSPPPLPPRFPGQGSPPRSPNDYRALPSPGRNFFYAPHRRPSQAEPPNTPYSDGLPYPSPVDYTSCNAETPSDQSTPAMAIDRMSIDGITNPPIGGYQCTNAGCTAPPFQTQYLLNSHANVHSQVRPHYCGVKGCPRSEGGKGFKRKNEMIRHGLVHDSPGYVCPFCPDREHKYPRPDNLQRHVRVHHTDKDKDDALLRDVLAQRPEGPSRGRRRRGTNG